MHPRRDCEWPEVSNETLPPALPQGGSSHLQKSDRLHPLLSPWPQSHQVLFWRQSCLLETRLWNIQRYCRRYLWILRRALLHLCRFLRGLFWMFTTGNVFDCCYFIQIDSIHTKVVIPRIFRRKNSAQVSYYQFICDFNLHAQFWRTHLVLISLKCKKTTCVKNPQHEDSIRPILPKRVSLLNL